MKSNLVKQIFICVLIIVGCGVAAFLIKGYFLPDNTKYDIVSPDEIKEKYEYNEFNIVNVTTEMLIQRYLVDFKDKLLTSPDEAYKLLDSDTKQKYNDYYHFKEMIDVHFNEFKLAYVDKYSVQKNKTTNKYTIVDQFGNKYIFSAKAVLLYNVNLELNDETTSIFK